MSTGRAVVALRHGSGRLEADGTVATLDTPYPSLMAYLRDGGRLADLDAALVRARSSLNDARVAEPPALASKVVASDRVLDDRHD